MLLQASSVITGCFMFAIFQGSIHFTENMFQDTSLSSAGKEEI